MGRLLLFWLRYVRRGWIPMATGITLAASLTAFLHVGAAPAVAVALVAVGALFWTWWVQAWRFARRARSFVAAPGNCVDLRYAPELNGKVDVAKHLAFWGSAHEEMVGRFGFPLRRRLVIFLYPTMAELGRLTGQDWEAAALPGGCAVLAAADGMSGGWPEESARHELAHLFADRIRRMVPDFLSEGLAVWLQGTEQGKPIGMQALAFLTGQGCIPLSLLVGRAGFDRDRVYARTLAASFTGFLIERFGWDAYVRFYRRAGSASDGALERAFEAVFECGWLRAEREWRDGLLARRAAFEPEISMLVCIERLRAAHGAWQLLQCIEEGEVSIGRWGNNARVMWHMACARRLLGHYEQAASLFEQYLDMRLHVGSNTDMGPSWLQLGETRDLLGRRDAALEAYHQALALPDERLDSRRSTHARARRYVDRPFSEQDELASLRH